VALVGLAQGVLAVELAQVVEIVVGVVHGHLLSLYRHLDAMLGEE
jgi:hypothetical protein